MKEIDYSQLNEAAQVLYDEAFRLGKRSGSEEANDRAAQNTAEGMLALANLLLDGEPDLRLVLIARRALRMTPLLANAETHAALNAVKVAAYLDNAGTHLRDVPDQKAVGRARDAVAAALQVVGDRRRQ